MQPYNQYLLHKRGVLTKLPKFQIDIPVNSTKGVVLERDVTVTKLYGNTCILVQRHGCRTPGSSTPGAQIVVYTIHRLLQTTRKTHILYLESTGRFALSIIDNLIVVHNQASCSSMLFDIGTENEGVDPLPVKSIVKPRSIRPYLLTLPGQQPFHCQLDTSNWVVFQPNIIIDAKLGLLWYVEIDIPAFIANGPPPEKLVDFLLRRRPDTTLPLLLQVLEDITEPVEKNKKNLSRLGQIFDMINAPYRKQLNMLAEPHIATPAGLVFSSQTQPKDLGPDKIVIDQCLTYSHIFSKYPEKKCLETYDGDLAIKIILEYIRSLNDAQIPVQELNKLLITCLLEEEHGLSRLHHLLQYRVLADSKPLACTLLSLENVYPPAIQLSLDMLKRLGNADDEIIEILLHKQLILPTIRFARSVGLADQISARKFLEAAQAVNNPALFYSVYKFFEQRNVRLKGTPNFAKGELCQPFVDHFKTLFNECNTENVKEAVK
ncbi:UNVERIFIED_CONTAM: hypothetical protein PYX00_001037 [Menopon gallinae]|uniref:Mic1 domain-containing protein n=1 Tax=Menopon gallinae TaxID=328185 RepID=A0AAW2IBB3_9NEOP